MTLQELKEIISLFFGFRLKKADGDSIVYEVKYKPYRSNLTSVDIVFTNDKLRDLIVNQQVFAFNETMMYNSKYFELLLNFEDKKLPDHVYKSLKAYQYSYDDVSYKIGKPSNEFTLFMLKKLFTDNQNFNLQDLNTFKSETEFRINRYFAETRKNRQLPDLIGLIKEILPQFNTMVVETEQSFDLDKFQNYAFSTLFQLSYKHNYTISPVLIWDSFVKSMNIFPYRKTYQLDNLILIKDLVLFYQKGISSQSLEHRYLSFYHIIEYFYKIEFEAEQDKRVSNGQSRKNFNERDALKLVLKKYIIDLAELKTDINFVNSNLLYFFKTSTLDFSDSSPINFDDTDNDRVIGSIKERIYTVRNAIVHSKEEPTTSLNPAKMFVPFRDEKKLVNDIHLIRIIAEKIMVASATKI